MTADGDGRLASAATRLTGAPVRPVLGLRSLPRGVRSWRSGLGVDLLYRRDGGRQPQVLISDTGPYTDMVFGLLKLLGLAYRPELADLPDQKLWRINPSADYGMLDGAARGWIDLGRVRQHWPDILRMSPPCTAARFRPAT